MQSLQQTLQIETEEIKKLVHYYEIGRNSMGNMKVIVVLTILEDIATILKKTHKRVGKRGKLKVEGKMALLKSE